MKTILALVLVALPWQGIEGYSLADTSLVQPGAWPNHTTSYHWWRDVCAIID